MVEPDAVVASPRPVPASVPASWSLVPAHTASMPARGR
jgi:hypothetical protein